MSRISVSQSWNIYRICLDQNIAKVNTILSFKFYNEPGGAFYGFYFFPYWKLSARPHWNFWLSMLCDSLLQYSSYYDADGIFFVTNSRLQVYVWREACHCLVSPKLLLPMREYRRSPVLHRLGASRAKTIPCRSWQWASNSTQEPDAILFVKFFFYYLILWL